MLCKGGAEAAGTGHQEKDQGEQVREEAEGYTLKGNTWEVVRLDFLFYSATLYDVVGSLFGPKTGLESLGFGFELLGLESWGCLI